MSKKDLSLRPQQVDDVTWYYEEPRGIHVIRQVWVTGRLQKTDSFVIPWGKLRASLRRKDKVEP